MPLCCVCMAPHDPRTFPLKRVQVMRQDGRYLGRHGREGDGEKRNTPQ